MVVRVIDKPANRCFTVFIHVAASFIISLNFTRTGFFIVPMRLVDIVRNGCEKGNDYIYV